MYSADDVGHGVLRRFGGRHAEQQRTNNGCIRGYDSDVRKNERRQSGGGIRSRTVVSDTDTAERLQRDAAYIVLETDTVLHVSELRR